VEGAAPIDSPILLPTLWFQTSEEARANQLTVYRAATRALEAAVADSSWSAVGQGAEAAALPPAVIVDVDETTLDNGPFEGRMVLEGKLFDSGVWSEWVERSEAEPIPGALDFVHRATELAVRVFYVTNRDAPQEAGTRANLARLGFPIDDSGGLDAVQCRGEQGVRESDKTIRIRDIARTHRVLLLVGDDLNDFVSGARGGSLAERRALAGAVDARFGESWFMLPNPIYGSWLRALLESEPGGDDPAEIRRRRLRSLRSFPAEDTSPR